MSKISRAEYLENIRNIINENMADNVSEYSGSDRFNVSRYIAALIEEGHNDPRLMSFLINWKDRLTGNEDHEYQFYRSFAEGLGAFSTGNMSVRKVLADMQETLDNFGHELEIYCNIDLLPGYDRVNCKMLYDEYLREPSDICRSEFIESLMDAYNENVEAAHRIMNLFADESLADTELRYKATNEQLDEYARVNRKIAKAREDRKIKKVQEKLEEYANSLFEQARIQREEEREANSLAGMANNNGLNLSEAIRSIAASDASKNKKLMETIDQYAGALQHGLYEERLYETFLKNIRPFEYLKPVEKATKRIYEAATKNALRINITKLLEEMSESASYQYLPLIEEACARYAKNPTPNNRVQARQCLVQFAHDPYCYAILEAIDNDNSKEANTLEEQVMTIKDTAKLIREKATTTPLYSPVQYIKEGECVFNANGTYFVKKNNTISKLSAEHVNQLSEKFVTLCKLVNDPAVQILENKIILHGTDKIGEIYEGYVDINKNRESAESLRNLQEMCAKYDFDTNFFIMCSCLLENFNNIAKINFGTHIALNSDPGVNVDMFRLGDNIFINTVNENMMSSTFFHNVNPLQCKNIINSHMGINVAAMFENLLPNQSKIMLRLNETKEEYMNSINKLESTIDKLEAGKKKCTDKTSIEKLDDNIKKAKEQLDEVKAEYKKWQEKVGEETGEETDDDEVNGDGNTREETTSQPLDDKEVDAQIDELSTPIDGAADETSEPMADEPAAEGEETAEPGEEDPFALTDDEFEQFITDDETDDETADETAPVDDEDPDLTNEINDFLDDNTEGDETAETDENPIISVAGETDDEVNDEIDAIVDDELGTDASADDVVPVDDPNAVDSGFDELPVEDDTLTDEPAADEVASDEDVILPEDGEVAEPETDEVPEGDEATDMFGGDTEDPIGLKADQTELPGEDAEDVVSSRSDIVAVMFDENIKTGEKYRSGYVSVVTPMVTGTGDLYNDMKNYKFYIDQDGNPVIDGDAMSAALYNGIVAKIKGEPLYDVFVREGVDKKDVGDIPTNATHVLSVDTAAEPVDFETDDTEADGMFKTTDLPDEFSVELDFNDYDDEPDETVVPEDEVDYNTGATAYTDEQSADMPFIPTYKSGDTEIELPAPTADGSVIPESKQTPKKKSVNEARKAIKGIKSVLNRKKDSDFFVNEASGKASEMKRQGTVNDLNEEIAGGASNDVSDSILEINDCPLTDIHRYARNLAAMAASVSGHGVAVSDIRLYFKDEESVEYDKPYYFTMDNTDVLEDGYTVYSIKDNVYVRPTLEFDQIRTDLNDEVPLQTIMALESEYLGNGELNHIDANNQNDAEFTIRVYLANLTNIPVSELEHNELNERCKIRKAKLTSGGDYLNSKECDDILHGDEEERDFKDDVEKDTQAAGVENPLAPSQPAQEEAYVPVLPNVHRAQELMENYDIIYETNDKVLYNRVEAEVINVSEDEKSVTIKLKDGTETTVPMSALEPDPEYVNDLNFDGSDDKSMLKDNPVSGQDLDAHTIDCDIVVDGHKINIGECWANINDIKDSKKRIRVLTEDGFVNEFDIDSELSFKNFPYAVVVDASGEPIRKIQIDPQAYVNATDDEPVRCICGGKETAFLKRTINILS